MAPYPQISPSKRCMHSPLSIRATCSTNHIRLNLITQVLLSCRLSASAQLITSKEIQAPRALPGSCWQCTRAACCQCAVGNEVCCHGDVGVTCCRGQTGDGGEMPCISAESFCSFRWDVKLYRTFCMYVIAVPRIVRHGAESFLRSLTGPQRFMEPEGSLRDTSARHLSLTWARSWKRVRQILA